MKNILLIYVPIFSCFLSFDLNHSFVQSNTYFLYITQYWMLPLLYFIGVLMFDCATIYYTMFGFKGKYFIIWEKKEVARLEEDITTLIYSIRWLHVLIITTFNRPRFINYNLLLKSQGLCSVLNFKKIRSPPKSYTGLAVLPCMTRLERYIQFNNIPYLKHCLVGKI